MANRDELIQQFIDTTGASADQAKFFLEMAGWELKVAVNQYYEFSEGGEADNTLGGAPATASGSSAIPVSASSPSSSTSRKPTSSTSKSSSSKFRTLSDLASGGNDEDSDSDQHQNFFAGGEKSGMVVQGPGKHNDIINQILKKAAEGGQVPEDDGQSAKRKPAYFKGSGYKLGSEEEPSQVIQPEPTSDTEDELEPVTRYLTFWRDGFSVDDGPLYRYDDPANQTMLNAINSGRAPLALLNVRHGQPVDVRVVRRQDENYVPPPKAPPKPFEGTGHRLGSPAAYVPATSETQAPGAFPASSSSSATTTPPQVQIDESQPTTSLQIRFGDGSRLVAKFNHTHTVGDVRRYIDASRPASRSYTLQTTFPVKELTNENQTLKEAGLLNAVVVQRYT